MGVIPLVRRSGRAPTHPNRLRRVLFCDFDFPIQSDFPIVSLNWQGPIKIIESQKDLFMSTFWRSFKSFPTRHPFAFSVGFTSAKTGFADYLAQTRIEKRDKVDLKRNAAFWVFGAWFLGGAQYACFVKLFTRLFPRAEAFAMKPLREKLRDKAGQRALGGQLLLDQLIWEPCVYFPMFWLTKLKIQGGTVSDAYDAWRRNIGTDVVHLWMTCGPVMFINFTFCPLWLRVPFVSIYSFAWTIYLSFARGDEV